MEEITQVVQVSNNEVQSVISKPKTRHYYLDVVKIIAIFFVCFYHFSIGGVNYDPDLNNYSVKFFCDLFFMLLCSSCVPLFFMANGAGVLSGRPFNVKKHLIKCLKMILTYFCFRAITILIIGLWQKVDFNVGFTQLIYSVFFLTAFPGVDLNHLWFIPALIGVYAISPFIIEYFNKEKPLKNNYFIPFMIILFIITFVSGDMVILGNIIFNKTVPFFNIGSFIIIPVNRCGFLLYFLLGGMISKYREKFKKIKWYYIVLTLIFGLALLGVYWYFQHTFWDFVFGSYTLFPTMLITCSIYLLCIKIDNCKVEKNKFIKCTIKIFGENTLTVYYLHWILCYTIFLDILKNIGYCGFEVNFLKSLLLVVICSLIGWSAKKLKSLFKIKLKKEPS